MKKRVFIFFLFMLFNSSIAQSSESLFEAINRYDVSALTQIIDKNLILDPYLLFLTRCYRDYLEKGIIVDEIEKDKVYSSLQSTLLYAKYQGLLRKKYDPLIHESLLRELKQNNSSFWQNEIGLTMIHYLILYSQNEQHLIPLLEAYRKGIDPSSLTSLDKFRFEQIALDIVMKKLEIENETNPNKKIEMQLILLDKFCPEINYYKGIVEKGWAIYNIEFTKNTEQAIKHLKKANSFFGFMKNYFGQKQIAYNQNSLGITLRDLGKFNEAIPIFQSLLNMNPIKENAVALLKIHTSLEKCYAALGISRKAHYHAKMVNRMQDSIYKLRQTETIIEKDYDQKIAYLSKKHTSLTTQFQTLIPIAGGLLLMVLVFIWLYKKTQSKKTILEYEKESTLREVQKLKQLVIKNHIILKDKTKVYINDLMYIKADDKYIRVFTSDGKNHLVRGRISDLDEQLPPNFIRTHRSYITNRNFIKQIQPTLLVLTEGTKIPISRKFRDQMP